MTKFQSIFSTCCEHSVRFFCSQSNQIIYQNANICFVTSQNNWFIIRNFFKTFKPGFFLYFANIFIQGFCFFFTYLRKLFFFFRCHFIFRTKSLFFHACRHTVYITRKVFQRSAKFLMSFCIKSGIHTGNKSLSCRFFITGSSVNLPGIKKSRNTFCFKRRKKLSRFHKIIFNSIARSTLNSIFKTSHCMHKRILNTFWQTGR